MTIADRRTDKAGSWPSVQIDDALKVVGLAGALLYGLLFVAYRRYYEALGVVPEDVGVTNSFILPRAVGFILLVSVLALLIAALIANNNLPTPESRWFRWRQQVVGTMLGLALAVFLSRFLPDSAGILSRLGIFSLVVLTSAVLVVLQRFEHFARIRIRATLVICFVVSLLVPAALVVMQARDSADRVLRGESVRALEVLSIPILDVQANPVYVSWVGEPEQRPAELFGNGPQPARIKGLLLGTNLEMTIVLFIDVPAGRSTVARISSTSVAISAR
jgi:hypothetical protein